MQLETVEYKTSNHQLTRHELRIQGAKIVAYESGQGAPVLLLHGSPDSHELWLPVMEYLYDDVRSIALDLPGFGESTLPDDFALTLDNEADFIRDLIAALNITEPVTLVTTDFGVHYGLAFTVKYPELVRGISISNSSFFHDYQWHFFAKLYRIPLVGEFLLGGTSRSMLQKTLKHVSPALPDSYIERSYEGGFGSPTTRKAILRLYRERNPKDFLGWEDKLLTILETKPALVLWGDRDPFITPQFGDRFGKAEVHHFENYSHWLPLEAPDEYAAVLLRWLRGL
jgi:pimeloyl-ACP methyl ester carboxylesterase